MGEGSRLRSEEIGPLSEAVMDGNAIGPQSETIGPNPGQRSVQVAAKAPKMMDQQRRNGGEGGIRTLGTLTRSTVFETAPFDHSGTSPSFKSPGQIKFARRGLWVGAI